MFKMIRRFVLMPIFVLFFPVILLMCLLYAEDEEEFRENLDFFFKEL